MLTSMGEAMHLAEERLVSTPRCSPTSGPVRIDFNVPCMIETFSTRYGMVAGQHSTSEECQVRARGIAYCFMTMHIACGGRHACASRDAKTCGECAICLFS